MAVASNDQRFWSEELRDHIFRMLRKRTRDTVDAEDLTHETFLRLSTSPAAAVTSINDYRAYATTTAVRLWIDFNARRSNSRVTLLADQPGPQSIDPEADFCQDFAEDPGEEVIAQEEFERMQAALETLPMRTREVFCLIRFEGMLVRAVAKKLGISSSTVKRIVRSTLRLLESVRSGGGRVDE